MSDTDDRWMSYSALADLLGIKLESARMLARRRKWLRRTSPNDPGTAQVLVPPDVGVKDPKKSAPKRVVPPVQQAPVPPPVPAEVTQALAALQAALERSDGDRRVLQQQADDLREKLAAAQLEAANFAGDSRVSAARAEGAERQVADLQRMLEELRQQAARRRWWRWW